MVDLEELGCEVVVPRRAVEVLISLDERVGRVGEEPAGEEGEV